LFYPFNAERQTGELWLSTS